MTYSLTSTTLQLVGAECGMSSYRRMVKSASIFLVLVSIIAMGCDSKKTTTSTLKPTRVRNRIIAQGQILPSNGLIRLAATPGDTLDEVHVKVDDVVQAGQTLITMRSLKLRQTQLESIDKRLADARQQRASGIEAARQRVEAAELRTQQVSAQRSSLERQGEVLKLAKQQVTSAQQIFERLQSIADDPLTRDFIGSIELDRQRSNVFEAELKFLQESEKLKQANESMEWSEMAAQQELKAARSALVAVEKSLALEAIESEKKALELQSDASVLKCPVNARVIAINGQVGEAAAQFPLIELADESAIVCSVEVPETDAALVEPDQTVTMTSAALGDKKLIGKVMRRERIVGRPALPPMDPLAIRDYRSSKVIVAIDPADVQEASKWLQLQVTVEIQLGSIARPTNDAPKSPTPQL